MRHLRFAILGAGFWSRFQLAGWNEQEGVECVAVCDRTRSKAECLAREFGVPAVYDDPEEMLRHESLDFVDVITDVDSHGRFVRMAAEPQAAGHLPEADGPHARGGRGRWSPPAARRACRSSSTRTGAGRRRSGN